MSKAKYSVNIGRVTEIEQFLANLAYFCPAVCPNAIVPLVRNVFLLFSRLQDNSTNQEWSCDRKWRVGRR